MSNVTTKYKILIKWEDGEINCNLKSHDSWDDMLKEFKDIWDRNKDADSQFGKISQLFYITWQPSMPYKPILWSLPKIFYIEEEKEDD